ncbi:MAG: DNA / pantothenate metabolism flavoprotein [Oceanicaulis sp. HLUCCA04]|nr:MAG: DNA / pantothenate metabolism flavoprotein [Oceanicaulis sp. HLUCCA04]
MSAPHIILTAGPTIEPIDPVRFLSNHSSGRQGFALADALAQRGAQVTLVSGPVGLPTPGGVTRVDVQTAIEMRDAVMAALPADAFIGVAAVADWRPAVRHTAKLKGEKAELTRLELVENPDILKEVARLDASRRPALVVGFAAETAPGPDELEKLARAKLERKGCDLIIANDVSGDVMGGEENSVLIVSRETSRSLPRAGKGVIAAHLGDSVMALLHTPSRG